MAAAPPWTDFTGLTRKAMEYSEQFEEIVRPGKQGRGGFGVPSTTPQLVAKGR